MNDKNSVVAIYTIHTAAEAAVKELQQSGFDMKKLSIAGRDFHTEEHVVGYYNTGDRMASWGKTGAFWGWIWGCLFGSAFFMIPPGDDGGAKRGSRTGRRVLHHASTSFSQDAGAIRCSTDTPHQHAKSGRTLSLWPRAQAVSAVLVTA